MTRIEPLPQTQSELAELPNRYWLPGLLTTDWDVFGESTRPEVFDSIDWIQNGPGQATYFGYKRNRLTSPRDFIPTGAAIFVGETDCIDIVGKANIYYGAPDHTTPAPYVGYISTCKPYQHRGLSIRRLVAMNSACLNFYGEELNSGADKIAPYARQAWQHLVRKGLAEAYKDGVEGQYERYRFLAQPAVAEM